MKKLLAMLLALILMMGVCMTTAQADGCYELLKLIYEDQEDDTFVYLGQGQKYDPNTDTDSVFFVVDAANGNVGVTGLNGAGKPEGYAWINVNTGDSLLAFMQFCIGYELLLDYVDECDGLVGAIFLTEDGDPYIVNSKSSADNFVDAVREVVSDK